MRSDPVTGYEAKNASVNQLSVTVSSHASMGQATAWSGVARVVGARGGGRGGGDDEDWEPVMVRSALREPASGLPP